MLLNYSKIKKIKVKILNKKKDKKMNQKRPLTNMIMRKSSNTLAVL